MELPYGAGVLWDTDHLGIAIKTRGQGLFTHHALPH